MHALSWPIPNFLGHLMLLLPSAWNADTHALSVGIHVSDATPTPQPFLWPFCAPAAVTIFTLSPEFLKPWRTGTTSFHCSDPPITLLKMSIMG